MVLDAARFADAQRTILTRAAIFPRGVLAALGIGAAFGIGIVVGGGMGVARGQPQPATTSLSVLELAAERGRALEEKRARVKLTYSAELQKPDALPVARPVETQLAPGTAKVPTAPSAPTAAQPASASIADDSGEALEPPPAQPADAAVTKTAAKEATSVVDKSADDEEQASPPPAVEKVDPKRLQQALVKVLGEAPAVVDARPAARAFSLQVASAPTRAGAEEVAKKLAAQGHQARVTEGDVGGKAVFRVRVGQFQDRTAAERYKARIATPSFVVGE